MIYFMIYELFIHILVNVQIFEHFVDIFLLSIFNFVVKEHILYKFSLLNYI